MPKKQQQYYLFTEAESLHICKFLKTNTIEKKKIVIQKRDDHFAIQRFEKNAVWLVPLLLQSTIDVKGMI